ncbi:hypothetical protein, partial [Thermoleptolyngbya sp.]
GGAGFLVLCLTMSIYLENRKVGISSDRADALAMNFLDFRRFFAGDVRQNRPTASVLSDLNRLFAL